MEYVACEFAVARIGAVRVPLAVLLANDDHVYICLLYTSDAADERSSVDLGGRRIIKKKKKMEVCGRRTSEQDEDSNT